MPSHPDSLWARIRRNLQLLAFAVVVLGVFVAIGAGFFVRGQRLMEGQLRERLQTAAALASHQFDGDALEKIRNQDDMQTPAFVDAVRRLKLLSEDIPNIRYAYIMRRTNDPNTLQFIADASSLDTLEELDLNGNGVVDDDEEASFPGDPYDITMMPALMEDAFLHPSVDPEITEDQWGALISGYAPIRNSQGQVIGILGIDMGADDFVAFTQSMFSPIALLLFIVASFFFTIFLVTFIWRRRVEMLRRVEDEQRGILMLATHQLGAPITIFKWSLESLLESRAKNCMGEEQFTDYVANMHDGIGRLDDILGTLRQATSVDQGKILYHPEQVRLSELIVGVVHTCTPLFAQRGQKLATELADNLSLTLDRQLITAVLRIILDNAMCFSREGATTTIHTRAHADFAEIEVRDQGCGIAKVDQGRVFEKFYRAHNAHLYKPDGAGLGLFIARGIIERAGGTMWIKSKEGYGTSVFVRLPMEMSGDGASRS